MDKYLMLSFSSAKLFSDKRQMTDIAPEFGIRLKRSNGLKFKEPITSHQIGNMLAVLLGERPSSTLRKGLHGDNEYYRNLANNGYLRIDNYMSYHKKKEIFVHTTEKLSSVKSVYNAYGSSVISWEIIRKYCVTKEIFDELIIHFERILGINDIQSIPMVTIRKMLSKFDISSMSEFIRVNKISAIKGYIIDEKAASNLLCKADTLITITNGIEDVHNFNGKIIIPLGVNDILKLTNSKGCSKLLDGGVVWVDSLNSEHEMSHIDLDEFKKISDISLETNY